MTWIGAPYRTSKSHKYYKAVSIDGDIYKINDTVCLLNAADPKNPFVAKIIQLFSNSKDQSGTFFMRNKWFFRHSDISESRHRVPDKRETLGLQANLIKKYELFESCRCKNMNALDVNDCETIDGRCNIMKIQDFAAVAKIGSQEEAEPDSATAIDSKVNEMPERMDYVVSNVVVPQRTFFCSYLYNPNNGIFRPKLTRTRKRQRCKKVKVNGQVNKKKRISDARPESPWCGSQVRIGDEFQLNNADIPRPCFTAVGSELLMKEYVEHNQRFQHDDHGHSQSFNVLRARSKHVDVENFIKIAKTLPYVSSDEEFFLQTLHQCDYNEADALRRISQCKSAGTKRRRRMLLIENRSNPEWQMRKGGASSGFMSGRWAYNVIESLGARLVPFSRGNTSPKCRDTNPGALCSPTHAKKKTPNCNRRKSGDESESENDDDNSDFCVICKASGMLLCCDGEGCGSSFHLSCLGLKKAPKEEKWLCFPCRQKEKHSNDATTFSKTFAAGPTAQSCMNMKGGEEKQFNPIFVPQSKREQNVPSPELIYGKGKLDMSLSPKNAMVVKSDCALKVKKRIMV